MGTTRLELHRGDHYEYKLLCATSSGKCDAGIPLVVTRGVWEQIRDQILSEGAVKADILAFYSPLPVRYEDILVETGTALSGHLKTFLSFTQYVPRYCLFVESILQIKKKRSKSSVQATAWTLFKTKEVDAALPYSFTYHCFDPQNEVSIKEAAEFIQGYVNDYKSEEVLTEFDEKIRRLSSVYPLSRVMRCEVDQSVEQRCILTHVEMLQGFQPT
jgi:hypothetical protein